MGKRMKMRTESELQKALRKIARREDGGAHEDLTRAALARLVLRLMAERQHMRMMDAARSQVRFL
jgi:hypothetical protein